MHLWYCDCMCTPTSTKWCSFTNWGLHRLGMKTHGMSCSFRTNKRLVLVLPHPWRLGVVNPLKAGLNKAAAHKRRRCMRLRNCPIIIRSTAAYHYQEIWHNVVTELGKLVWEHTGPHMNKEKCQWGCRWLKLAAVSITKCIPTCLINGSVKWNSL